MSGSFDVLQSSEDTFEEEDVAVAEDVPEEPVRTEGKNQYEGAADDAFLEVSERLFACGGNETYPFEVGENYIAVRDETEQSVYVFLLLLSTFGHDAGPAELDGAQLFEEICAQAAETYLGGQSGRAHSRVFGFPRRSHPKDFGRALDDLCRAIGEGKGHRPCRLSKDQKDAKLDVVGWRAFPDGRPGKSLAFGQCATGNDWRGKRTELQSQAWCEQWMQETPVVPPMRFFFIPHRIPDKEWAYTCRLGGVLFERCRIAHLVGSLGPDLSARLNEWSRFVLNQVLRV